MDEDALNLSYGDGIEVVDDPYDPGVPAVRIQNRAFVEDARWIRTSMAPGHDRTSMLNELIRAIEKLRDHEFPKYE